MKITLPDGGIKEIKIGNRDMPIDNLLKELDINPVGVIVVKNDKIVTEDETVRNEDEIRIIMIINGG